MKKLYTFKNGPVFLAHPVFITYVASLRLGHPMVVKWWLDISEAKVCVHLKSVLEKHWELLTEHTKKPASKYVPIF